MIDKLHKRLIEENPVALATIHEGKPNLIVTAFLKVVSPNQILVTDNYMNTTIKDLTENGDVCLAVWNHDWNGLKIIGKAKYHSEGEWLSKVKAMKENEGLPAKGAIIIDVEKIVALK